MTWRAIFARAWFVLRSRLARHHPCPDCGWPMDYVPRWPASIAYEWRCEACADIAKAQRQAELDAVYDWIEVHGYNNRPVVLDSALL